MVLDLADGVGVERLAQHVEHVAEHGVAHRHLQAVAQVADLGAPGQSVGGLEADAADPAVADLLGHLGHDELLVALEGHVHLDGAVDLGQGVGRELDVDDRSGDGHHPPGGRLSSDSVGWGAVVVMMVCFPSVGQRRGRGSCGERTGWPDRCGRRIGGYGGHRLRPWSR